MNTTTKPTGSVLFDMAERYGMDPATFEKTVRATCSPKKQGKLIILTPEEFGAFLLVAREYDLNPLTKEIYAFPATGGGIVPIVAIDGWMNLINRHPEMDGMEFDDHLDESGNLTAVTCKIYRKDRSHPTPVTEYMAECRRDIDTWNRWPRRMLRHKAAIQAARYAFGFAGIYDPDEGERVAGEDSALMLPPPAPPETAPKQLEPPSAEAVPMEVIEDAEVVEAQEAEAIMDAATPPPAAAEPVAIDASFDEITSPGVEDHETFRSWVDQLLAKVTPEQGQEGLQTLYNSMVEPEVEKITIPSNRTDIAEIYAAHEERLVSAR